MAYRGGRNAEYGAAARDAHMENENDAMIGRFAGQVSQLKELTIQINGHLKEDNKLLGELDGSFDSTSGLLGGVTKRLGLLSKNGGGNNLCFLAAFVFFVFLLLWRLTKG